MIYSRAIMFVSFLLIPLVLFGQEWELQLENEKIKVYTKDGEEDNIKSYKAISSINFPAEEIYKVYIDFDNYTEGQYILISAPCETDIEEDEFVRLNKFYQNTTLVQETEKKTNIIMEGKFDAGGAVPAWLMNMFVVKSPLNSVKNMEKYLEKKLK